MRMQGLSGRNLGCGFPVLSLMHSCVPSDWGKFYTGGMRSQYSTAFSGQSSMYDCITSKPHQHIITSKIPIYNIGYHGCELRQVQISHEIWSVLRKIHGWDVEWRIIIPTDPTAPVVQRLNGFPGDGLGGTGRGWRPHDHQGHPWRLTKDIQIYDSDPCDWSEAKDDSKIFRFL